MVEDQCSTSASTLAPRRSSSLPSELVFRVAYMAVPATMTVVPMVTKELIRVLRSFATFSRRRSRRIIRMNHTRRFVSAASRAASSANTSVSTAASAPLAGGSNGSSGVSLTSIHSNPRAHVPSRLTVR